ncbi:MAG TPA: PIN domain-containing protein [Solirubrobacteraceae bacterium]|nr:PIN domain-containing protein [Solirubrobacteraceae bacterium]
MIVLDTSIVLAVMDRRDVNHERVREWMDGVQDELCTTPLVLAELDYLVPRRGGSTAAQALRDDFQDGAYLIEWWRSALRETIAAACLYESIDLGLTDASLVALAAHLETTQIATLDERHFRAVQPSAGGATSFTLLPADWMP